MLDQPTATSPGHVWRIRGDETSLAQDQTPPQQNPCAWTCGFVRSGTVGNNSLGHLSALTFRAIDEIREISEHADEKCRQDYGNDYNRSVHSLPRNHLQFQFGGIEAGECSGSITLGISKEIRS